MLNLKVCRKCHKDEIVPQWPPGEEEVVLRTGVLACPYHFQGYYEASTDINNPPPEWCEHKLEHAVSEGMTKWKK